MADDETPAGDAIAASPHAREAIAATQTWLTRAVIGLNLCPFAKSVHVKAQIRYAISEAMDAAAVADDLERELRFLAESDPQIIDTTVLILPSALQDFGEYNDFLERAERMLKRLRLRGILQIASFHPDYQFADTEPDDIENYTNRSPYPILHLLREESVARAVEAYPDPERIYLRNQETLRKLGKEGWKRLFTAPRN